MIKATGKGRARSQAGVEKTVGAGAAVLAVVSSGLGRGVQPPKSVLCARREVSRVRVLGDRQTDRQAANGPAAVQLQPRRTL